MSVNPLWHLLREGEVVDSARARDLHCARLILNPQPDEWVESDATNRLGHIKLLKAEKCRSCGVRDRMPKKDQCERCATAQGSPAGLTRHERWYATLSQERKDALRERINAGKRAARKARRGSLDARGRFLSAASRKKMGAANVRIGVEFRKAKREQQERVR